MPAIRTDVDLSDYIRDLADAGEDCRAQLGRVRGLVSVPTGHK